MNDTLRRISTIGRPLDPAWATNRAVLVLMPVGGVLAGAAAAMVPGRGGVVTAGLSGLAVVLGGWAVGRELDPDRQAAAFVSLALAFGAFLLVPVASLVLLFTALVLARVVNRTVGPPATPLDAVAVLGLTLWALVATGNPLVALPAAAAFGADATLPGGARRHWAAAGVALGMGGGAAVVGIPGLVEPGLTLVAPSGAGWLLAAVVGLSFLATVIHTRRVDSRADATGQRLEPGRVRAGMGVVLLLALVTLAPGDAGLREGALLWASLAGVAFWRPLGRLGQARPSQPPS